MDDLIKVIPEKWRGTVLVLAVLSPYITRAYHAVSSGGGLRSMISSIWFGTNTPKPKQDSDKTPPTVPMILLVAMLSLGCMTTITGCSTVPKTREAIVFNAYRDVWTVAHSAYEAHCENVVQGKVSKEKEAQVDAAWNKFRLIFNAAVRATNQDWTQLPPASLDVAEAELLKLIRTL